MKRMLIAVMLILNVSLFAQEEEAVIIANSFKTGNVQVIATYFSSSLDMTVIETEDVFSKAQATQILNQFFKANPPSSFSVKHKGASKSGDYYQIGTLSTNKGEYRVTYFLKKDKGLIFIKRLKIEDNEGEF